MRLLHIILSFLYGFSTFYALQNIAYFIPTPSTYTIKKAAYAIPNAPGLHAYAARLPLYPAAFFWIYPILGGLGALALSELAPRLFQKKGKHVARIGSFRWVRNDFCRGWLITGGTGSGKTEFIKVLLTEIFKNEAGQRGRDGNYTEYPWGGISLDAKGDFNDIVVPMAAHFGRSEDICMIKTRPDGAPEDWIPPVRFNLLSDYTIPSNTYAASIVETATQVAGGEGDKGFFKTQAESNIGWCIELHRAIRACQIEKGIPREKLVYPSLKNVLLTLTDRNAYNQLLLSHGCVGRENMPAPRDDDGKPVGGPKGLPYIDHEGRETPYKVSPPKLSSQKLQECLEHFAGRYWSQPKDQLGGVHGTITNYLNYFAGDDIAEVFCADNTFDFSDIEKGKIVCISMPQKLRIERRYVNTILKLLFYQQATRRFDREKKGNNLLIALQDEAQKMVTKDDGEVDILRAASATTIMATQSKSSLLPVLGGKEKAEPLILNLRNRVIYTAADEGCAEGSSQFLGKIEKNKVSISKGKGTSRSISKEDQYIIKPSEFRSLKKFTAVVCHADGRYDRWIIAPKDIDGKRSRWWPIAAEEARLGWWYNLKLKLGIDPDYTRIKIKKN